MITWAGGAAEHPPAARRRRPPQPARPGHSRRRAALRRLALGTPQPAAADLHPGPEGSLRLPRLPPGTDVTDGLDAVQRYHAWLASHDETIRTQLTAYNRDDIDALAHTISRLRDLAPGTNI